MRPNRDDVWTFLAAAVLVAVVAYSLAWWADSDSREMLEREAAAEVR